MKHGLLVLALLLALPLAARAGDDLHLNDHLDYNSDSQDGPLITGKDMRHGVVAGKPNYVIIYEQGCYNSKRQARRSVSLYQRYKERVNFVVVDMDQKLSREQEELVRKYYRGYIPHVVVLDKSGRPLYNAAGEVDEGEMAAILDKALQ